MPVRLGHFYALVLLLTCLGINIAFFSEVREPFLGSDDPTASIKSALSELDINARIAEFYPPLQSKAEEVPHVPPPIATKQKPAHKESQKEPEPPASISDPEPVPNDPVIDPSLLPSPPPEEAPKTKPKPSAKEEKPKESEIPKPMAPDSVLKENLQTAASTHAPHSAAVQPIIADQFKPIMPELVKPSADTVWDTMNTALERPVRYD